MLISVNFRWRRFWIHIRFYNITKILNLILKCMPILQRSSKDAYNNNFQDEKYFESYKAQFFRA